MTRLNVGLIYAAVTSGLLVANWVSFGCSQCETLVVWAAACALLALSQIAFLSLAVRMRYGVIAVMASAVLLGIAGFVYLLAHMVS